MPRPDLTNIKSLAMLKMEKNFRAHNERGNPRDPYESFSNGQLIEHLREEVDELEEALASGDIHHSKEEVADASNILDFLFERLANGRVT